MPNPLGGVALQANINLDVLLEKMKAELEKAKRFESLKFDGTVEECIDKARRLVKERDLGKS